MTSKTHLSPLYPESRRLFSSMCLTPLRSCLTSPSSLRYVCRLGFLLATCMPSWESALSCVSVCAHQCACLSICVCTKECVFVCMPSCACVDMCMYVHQSAWICAHVYVCMPECLHAYMHFRVWAYGHIYVFTHQSVSTCTDTCVHALCFCAYVHACTPHQSTHHACRCN